MVFTNIWGEDELEKLKKMVEERGRRGYEAMATELGTGRTAKAIAQKVQDEGWGEKGAGGRRASVRLCGLRLPTKSTRSPQTLTSRGWGVPL
eukprot:COSAG04_NODE_8016_length_1034_cov_0.981818_2_plen_92_part_00